MPMVPRRSISKCSFDNCNSNDDITGVAAPKNGIVGRLFDLIAAGFFWIISRFGKTGYWRPETI
jgi:hypothetical protein